MDNRGHNMLDDDRVGRLLLKLALPAFAGMFVMTLYNVVDTIFIGHYVGPLGIAGLSLVFPIQMLAMGIGQMTGMGGASLISRLIGGGNTLRAERALGNAITACLAISATVMVVGLIDADFWLRLMGASETVLPYARDYMTIILIGMFFQTFAMSLSVLIRSEGNARVPMLGMIIGALLNIILDAVFIIPLDMGIKGAALATVIAQMFSVAYYLIYYLSGNSYLKFRFSSLIIEWSILKDIMTIGIAAFARTVAGTLSAVFVNRMLVAYGGDFAISAFGIINRVMMFVMMPAFVSGSSLQPVLGFNYGARRPDRALRAMKLTFFAATAICLSVFLVIYFFPQPIIRIFTDNPELVSLAAYAGKIVFSATYLIGFIVVSSVTFQALGKATQALTTALARPVLFLLPLLFTLPNIWGLEGVFLAFPLSDGLTFVLTLFLLIPQIRMFRRLAADAREKSLAEALG
ncbi:MATE family efflux transporter [Chloroflexota bacterium]